MSKQPQWIPVERFKDAKQRSKKTVGWAHACPGYRFMSEPDPNPRFKGYYRVVYWGIPQRMGPSIIKKHLRMVLK